MKDYLLVILAAVLLAFGFVLQKLYQNKNNDSGSDGIDFSILSAICSVFFLLFTSGFSLSFTWYSFINALLKTSCCIAYTIIGFKILKEGKVALYTLFLMCGGMLLPAVWGWLFLNENPKFLHVIGVIVILVAVILNGLGKEKPSFKVLLMCSAVFVLNGFVSVFSKLHQTNTTFATMPTADYTLLSVLISLVSSVCLKIALQVKSKSTAKKTKFKLNFKIIPFLIVLLYSIVGTVSSVLQLEGAKNLPASMLYPMITGGSVALSGIFALIFFKEKMSIKNWISVILCILGTCLFI